MGSHSQEELERAMEQAVADFESKKKGGMTKAEREQVRTALAQEAPGAAVRETGFRRGLERGKEFFGEGSLGRVSAELSPEQQRVRQLRSQYAEQGLGAPAMQAAREQRLRGLQRQQQLQQRALGGQQAQMGVTGGAAAGQLGNLFRQQQMEQQSAEQALLLEDAARRQQYLGDLERTLGTQEQDILGREQYNIQQAAKELQAQLATGLAEEQLGIAERTGLQQAQAAQAAAQAGGGGGKK